MNSKTKKNLLFSGLVLIVSFIFFSFSAEEAQAGQDGFVLTIIKKFLSDANLENIGSLLLKMGGAIIGTAVGFFEIFLWMIFKLIVLVVQDLFTAKYYQETLGGFAVNEIVIQGWKVISSICNMLYILILLFIGVGTLLRIEKYNYKKTLIRLIVAALLTNFSLLFSGIILDLFHILMFNGAFKDPLTEVDQAITKLLWGPFSNVWEFYGKIFAAKDMMTVVAVLGGMIAQAIFVALAAIAILAIAMFLVIRTIALWILLVLSPVAYIGMVLPDTQGIAQKWWGSFLKYAMAGPILFFFLWFSSNMIITIQNKAEIQQEATGGLNDLKKAHLEFVETNKVLGDEEDMQTIVTNHNVYAYMMFATFLLYGSLIAASSLSIAGAGRITRLAQIAVVGAAVGAQKLGFRSTKKVLSGAGKRLEGVGSVPPGKSDTISRKMARGAGHALNFGAGTAKVLSTLEPITLSRGLWGRLRKTMDAQQVEDEESLSSLGSIAAVFLGGKAVEAGDSKIREREDERKKSRKRLTEIEGEEQSLDSPASNLSESEKIKKKEELEKEKTEIGNKLENELNEKNDNQYRRKAAREVYGKQYRDFFYEDRVHDAKVNSSMENSKLVIKTNDQAVEHVRNAATPEELEGVLRIMATRGMKVEAELRDKGILRPQETLNTFIDRNFKGNKERAGEILKADLENLAIENKNYSEVGKTIIDPQTGKRRPATEEERKKTINKILSSKEQKDYARSFQADLIVKKMPDGTREKADTAEVAINNMTAGFMEAQKKSKTIAPSEIKDIEDFIKDPQATKGLSKEHMEMLKELIRVTKSSSVEENTRKSVKEGEWEEKKEKNKNKRKRIREIREGEE